MKSARGKILVSLFLLLAPLALGASSASAGVSRCRAMHAPVQREDVDCLVEELIHESFPELQRAWREGRIALRSFRSKAYFLKTSYRTGHLRRDRSKRRYSIDLNPMLFDADQVPSGPPTVEALQGILAHELVHLMDYEKSNALRIARIGSVLALNPTPYERWTDLRSFRRGYARGIRAYRVWIYGKLTPRDLATKKKRYFTPEEIDCWIEENPAN